MLQCLRVRNFAIVESLDVAFERGLNVITGETGAGKSILVGALALVLGARADRSQIRAGSDQCMLEAAFELDDADAVNLVLEELALPPAEDGRLIVRRVLTATGAGRQLVNDSPTTLQGLKRIGDLLVDLHGPHEHQSLLSTAFQLDLLDSYGHLSGTRAPYESTYEKLQEIRRREHELAGDDQQIAQQIDLAQFQIRELEAAELESVSEEQLNAEHAQLANAREILTLGQAVMSALTEDELCAFSRLTDSRRQLDALSRLTEEAKLWESEADHITRQLQALAGAIQRRLQDIEIDPERLLWVEDRIGLLHKLKRKYGASIDEMRTFLADARTRLVDLEGRTQRLAALQTERRDAEQRMQAAGERLSTARAKAAASLGQAVTAHLRDLGFLHGEFAAQVAPASQPGPSGLDTTDFGFAPNVGEPMRPLRLIASSGEISRVMLATKAVLARHDRVPVLVFDEVDANVGGEMGVAIGEKLAAVAEDHQVLCITHLPQVAARGSTHFAVSKRVTQGRTYTAIEPVQGAAREEELARMLGGKDLTTVTLRHARELLGRSGQA